MYANASQEAAALVNYEEDRAWFDSLGGYDGEPLEAPDPADLARFYAARDAYRAQKLELYRAAVARMTAAN